MAQSSTHMEPGTVLQDSYRIDRLLGEGGMGATYAGLNLATGHEVAIKVMTAEFARNTKAAELFRREANLMRTLNNDAIVGFETSLFDKSGQMILVMEFIKGKPLGYFLERKARLAPVDVLKLARRLLDGLAAIHRLGIVHRDISPDNVMIPEHDILAAKLIDFGVASDTIGTDKSLIGDTFVGKIGYASPEQLGLGGAKVGAASDLYSLGLVLMRTAGLNVPGLGGTLADAIDARRNDIRVQGAKIPEPLQQVLEALLRSDPSARPTEPLLLVERAINALNEATATPASDPLVSMDLDDALAADEDPFAGEEPAIATRSKMPAMAAAVAVVIAALGLGGYYVLGPGGTAGGGGSALDQALLAQEAVAAEDPLAEITAMIDAGGEANLNAAFGALMAMVRDEEKERDIRGLAALRIARMYDPNTFDTARSPFPAANASAAKRFYGQAKDLGNSEAQAALARIDG